MTVETDGNRQLVLPHHDGSLLGVSSGEEVWTLSYRATDGVEREIQLSGVHAMDVSGLREGNTILSIMVVPRGEAESRVSSDLLLRLGWGTAPRLRGKFVFVLDCSYGADVIADCEEVEISEVRAR